MDSNSYTEIAKIVIDMAIKTGSSDKYLNSIYGPMNCGDWYCDYSPQGKCRMICCLCREADEDIEDEVDEWFYEECDNCNDYISDRLQALRIPLEGGGWKGCFCCLQCIKDVYYNGEVERVLLVDAMEINLLEDPISKLPSQYELEEI